MHRQKEPNQAQNTRLNAPYDYFVRSQRLISWHCQRSLQQVRRYDEPNNSSVSPRVNHQITPMPSSVCARPGNASRKVKTYSTIWRKVSVAVATIMLSLGLLTSICAAEDASTAYLRQVEGRIMASWHPPPETDGLTVSVSYHLARDGTVSSVRIGRSSGNPRFDSSALLAVRVAGPFPQAPESFRGGTQLIVLHRPAPARNLGYYEIGLLVGLAAFLISVSTGRQTLGLCVPPIVCALLIFILWHSNHPGANRQSVVLMFLMLFIVAPALYAVSFAGSLIGSWVRQGIKWCLKKA